MIFTRFQRLLLLPTVSPARSFTSIACIHYLDAVVINNSIIVMRIQDAFFPVKSSWISLPAYLDKFFTPLGLGCMFILHGFRSSHLLSMLYPFKSDILPSVSRLLEWYFHCPAYLVRMSLPRTWSSSSSVPHETVGLSVYFNSTSKRKVLYCPMFTGLSYGVRSGPCTGIRIDHHPAGMHPERNSFFSCCSIWVSSGYKIPSCSQQQHPSVVVS